MSPCCFYFILFLFVTEKTKVTTVFGLLIVLFHGERETNDFTGNLWLLIIACLGCSREPPYIVNQSTLSCECIKLLMSDLGNPMNLHENS